MIIAVLKESYKHEKRTAISPETVKKLKNIGFEVIIEKDAGLYSGYNNELYKEAGAKIEDKPSVVCNNADILIKVQAPTKDELKLLKNGAIVIANFSKFSIEENQKTIAAKKLTCFALEKMPRISRAQNMDILSSQDNLAGYKAVLEAVNIINSAVPMMTTSAGTIAPAKIFILGIGVAGLQAIATAKRLGAMVFASDIRPETKEQAASLGGKYVEPEEVNDTLNKMNIIITVAGAAGKAPILIKKAQLEKLSPNTLVYDMVGNVEGLKDDEEIVEKDILLVSNHYLASKLAASTSKLFANNIYNFLELLYDKETKELKINFEDEIIKDTCIADKGDIK